MSWDSIHFDFVLFSSDFIRTKKFIGFFHFRVPLFFPFIIGEISQAVTSYLLFLNK